MTAKCYLDLQSALYREKIMEEKFRIVMSLYANRPSDTNAITNNYAAL